MQSLKRGAVPEETTRLRTVNGGMPLKKSKTAPKWLSVEARTWWRKLTREFDIADSGGLLLLQTGLEAFDRMRQAQAVLEKDGMTVLDRFNQRKPNPATVVERDSRAGLLGALRALNLDVEPLRDRPGRPGGS